MANVKCTICGDRGHVASDCKQAAEQHKKDGPMGLGPGRRADRCLGDAKSFEHSCSASKAEGQGLAASSVQGVKGQGFRL